MAAFFGNTSGTTATIDGTNRTFYGNVRSGGSNHLAVQAWLRNKIKVATIGRRLRWKESRNGHRYAITASSRITGREYPPIARARGPPRDPALYWGRY